LQDDALFGELFSLEQNNKPTLQAASPPTLTMLPDSLHTLPCACVLRGAIPSLHAQQEQQRFLFLAELLA
jgi:hypothetical protein